MNTCPMEAWTPSFLVRTSQNLIISAKIDEDFFYCYLKKFQFILSLFKFSININNKLDRSNEI